MRLHRGVLLAGALLVAGCAGGSALRVDRFGLPLNQPVTRAELRAHPEASLRYPGSRPVRAVGSDETAKPHGQEPDPAYVGAILTAAVSPSLLYGWYGRLLTARGYRQVVYYRLSDQVSGEAWQLPDGREQIQVAVFNPRLLAAQQITAEVPAGGIVYEELLVDYRVVPGNEH